jgi:multicomponent Na+:H+ antiporter subunit E
MLRFVPYFLRASLLAGLDVMRRALDPRMPIDPALVRFPLRLPPGPARATLAAVVSLLPGTLSVELEHEQLLVHVLDRRLAAGQALGQLEDRVADVFGLTLD